MRIAIIAAHPDDETIGASALIGAYDTTVIHVTDGAPREPRWWPAGVGDRAGYAALRASEAARALALARTQRAALGVVDQEAAHALPQLITALARELARQGPDLVITHAYEGGHPDHDAVALAVARAVARLPAPPRVVEMALYHGAPGALVAGQFLDGRRAACHAVCHALAPHELARRRAMLACFASQRVTLAPFATLAHESYRWAPRYDFAAPPHPGPLWYERLGLSLTGAAWRDLAARAPDA